MRFHTAVMLYVLTFSPFFTLTKTQYAVLILTISSVISAEMLNTAAEELADLSAADYNPWPGLLRISRRERCSSARFSVVVGAVILWQPDAFARSSAFPGQALDAGRNPGGYSLIAVYVAKAVVIGRSFARWLEK